MSSFFYLLAWTAAVVLAQSQAGQERLIQLRSSAVTLSFSDKALLASMALTSNDTSLRSDKFEYNRGQPRTPGELAALILADYGCVEVTDLLLSRIDLIFNYYLTVRYPYWDEEYPIAKLLAGKNNFPTDNVVAWIARHDLRDRNRELSCFVLRVRLGQARALHVLREKISQTRSDQEKSRLEAAMNSKVFTRDNGPWMVPNKRP